MSEPQQHLHATDQPEDERELEGASLKKVRSFFRRAFFVICLSTGATLPITYYYHSHPYQNSSAIREDKNKSQLFSEYSKKIENCAEKLIYEQAINSMPDDGFDFEPNIKMLTVSNTIDALVFPI